MTVKIFDAPYDNAFTSSSWYTDNGNGEMRDGRYVFTGERGGWFSSDWLIAIDSPYACFYTDIPKERRILFFGEPPEIRDYRKYLYYLNQFGTIVSMYELPDYTGRTVISNPRLGWTAGIKGAMNSMKNALNYPVPAKTKTLSMIMSLKHSTKYHRKRIAFMNEIKKEFGEAAECFGRDFRPIDDKLDAIAPYKYHIAMENSRHKHYWTEKLTDAWACWSLPIYFGDPSILEQIPDRRGIEVIDLDDFPEAIRKIHEIIDNDIYASRIEAIRTCREWALKQSNRYEFACEIIEKYGDDTPKLKSPELFRILLSRRKFRVYKALRGISEGFADKAFDSYCRIKGRFWE